MSRGLFYQIMMLVSFIIMMFAFTHQDYWSGGFLIPFTVVFWKFYEGSE